MARACASGVQDVVALLRAERGRGVALVELTPGEDAPVLGRRPTDLELPAGGGSHIPVG